jgi:hypothetical protein
VETCLNKLLQPAKNKTKQNNPKDFLVFTPGVIANYFDTGIIRFTFGKSSLGSDSQVR